MRIQVLLSENGPAGKVADAELHFDDGALAGLKLVGFGIWESKFKSGGYNVTFPARQYSSGGERRSFALLRPILDGNASKLLQAAIIAAYQATVEAAA